MLGLSFKRMEQEVDYDLLVEVEMGLGHSGSTM